MSRAAVVLNRGTLAATSPAIAEDGAGQELSETPKVSLLSATYPVKKTLSTSKTGKTFIPISSPSFLNSGNTDFIP